MEGVDYSWARPGGAALKNAGKHFAVRYIPYPGHGGKGINQAELDDLRAHGLAVAMVFESYAKRPLEGFGAGVADAQESQRQLESLGMGSLPCYFAVDWDATEAQQAVIDEYLRGAASVLGLERVGVYAGYWIIKRCFENKTATYLWQTYAWSGGNVHPEIHLYQYLNGQDLNGAVDFNKSMKENFGQLPATVSTNPPVQQTVNPPADGTYVVVANDNLTKIAAKFGTSVDNLVAINGIQDRNLIRVGQVLRISGATPAPVSQVGGRYTVKPNDNLTKIGEQFGVSVDALVQANGIADRNLIRVGQVLVIPGSGAAPAPAAVRSHTVKSGETLSGIASQFGTTWQVLKAFNGIVDENKIYPNQVIRIP